MIAPTVAKSGDQKLFFFSGSLPDGLRWTAGGNFRVKLKVFSEQFLALLFIVFLRRRYIGFLSTWGLFFRGLGHRLFVSYGCRFVYPCGLLTMVNSEELVDLNPALEDILSMWGKDTTAQNVEHFFGVQKLAESILQQSAVLPPFLHQGEVTASENVQVHEQDVHVRAYENAAAKGPESGFTVAGHKGKSVVTWNPSSAGFGVSETLGRFSGSFQGFSDGGVPPLTRVSLPKDTRATRVSLPGDCEEFLGAGEGGTRTGEDLSSGKSAQGFFVGGPTNF